MIGHITTAAPKPIIMGGSMYIYHKGLFIAVVMEDMMVPCRAKNRCDPHRFVSKIDLITKSVRVAGDDNERKPS